MATVHKYYGRTVEKEFWHDVGQVEGGTVSPGGAAQMLGYSRPRIHQLLNEGRFEAWIYYSGDALKPGLSRYICISVRDIESFGYQKGKIPSPQKGFTEE